MVFDRWGEFVKELNPADVFAASSKAVINGEDSLTIKTSDYLIKGQRIVFRDARGLWHEYIVAGGDEAHDSGRNAIGSYFCENSWAELRTAPFIIDKRPGTQNPVTANNALSVALSGTRWTAGTGDTTATGGTTWYHVSPWEAVVDILDKWGGQLECTIAFDTVANRVSGRKLTIVKSLGSSDSVRFDYGSDVAGISVDYDESDICTALYCYGKGVDTGSGSFGRKLGIESVNSGKAYVEDSEAKAVWGQVGKNGETINAFGIFEDGQIEDAAELKAAGLEALKDAARPKVTYSATVATFHRAGTDLRGVGLGDTVSVVDTAFYSRHKTDRSLRLMAQVVEVVEDLINPMDTQITLGDLKQSIGTSLGTLTNSVNRLTSNAGMWDDVATSAAYYLDSLIEGLNAQINATGGYTYIKPGQGIWVYDAPEDGNPTQVINLMGGSMRIANSKTSAGEWDWRSVFVSGHVAADMVTAANLLAGRIQSADGTSYWDLDSGEFVTQGMTAEDATLTGEFSCEDENDRLVIDAASVRGFRSGTYVGTFDFKSGVSGEQTTDQSGLRILSVGGMQIAAPSISVGKYSGSQYTTTNDTIYFCGIPNYSGGSWTWDDVQLVSMKFVNGMCVTQF